MDFFMKAFTATGLTQATGLNPVLPLLLVAIAGRYEWFFVSHRIPAPVSLPENLLFITSGWAILFIAIITVLEFVIDKAQWFDNVKHVTIDPVAGSLSSAGITFTVMAKPLENMMSRFGGGNDVLAGLPSSIAIAGMSNESISFWVAMVILILFGLCVTISFLIIKTVLRWVISAIPDMGVSNILISMLEDGIVLISIVLAFFFPILSIIFTFLLAIGAIGGIIYLKKRADERERRELRNLCFVGEMI